MPRLRLRPPRHAGAMSGMRDGGGRRHRDRGRTVKRYFFAILSAISLLLCAAMLTLWLRSYWRQDRLAALWFPAGTHSMRNFELVSRRGAAVIAFITFAAQDVSDSRSRWQLDGNHELDGSWSQPV